MTPTQTPPTPGATVYLVEGPLLIPVTITGIKTGYGRTMLQVTPEGGAGRLWVNADRTRTIDATDTDQ